MRARASTNSGQKKMFGIGALVALVLAGTVLAVAAMLVAMATAVMTAATRRGMTAKAEASAKRSG